MDAAGGGGLAMMIESKMLTATEIQCREAWAAAELAEDFAANQRAQAKLLGDLAAFLEPSSLPQSVKEWLNMWRGPYVP
jgi:hypothetical protein